MGKKDTKGSSLVQSKVSKIEVLEELRRFITQEDGSVVGPSLRHWSSNRLTAGSVGWVATSILVLLLSRKTAGSSSAPVASSNKGKI